MTVYPCAAVLQRKVYIGGGYTVNDECTVQVYDIESNEWSLLPRYQCRRFAMTILHSLLDLTIGGRCSCILWEGLLADFIGTLFKPPKATNQLVVFDTMSQDWMYPYPPMPTPCWTPAVSTYDIWLLVAGGCDGSDLTTVELLNTSTNQWLSASPLSTPCSHLTSTVLQEDWFIIMNSRQVFCVSLPDIVSQTVTSPLLASHPYYGVVSLTLRWRTLLLSLSEDHY